MITVIMAAKDSEKWVQETLNSLKSQTYQDWKCIISVNGSSDATLDICTSQDDSRIEVIRSKIPNKSLALNRAIVSVKSEWISILDADDLWHNEKLAVQISQTSNEVDVLGTQMHYINSESRIIDGAPSLPLTHWECVSNLINNTNPVANSSVIYRKSIHDRVGYYDPELFGVEDYDMWKRCARLGAKFSNLSEKFLFHRLHQGSSFNSASRQQSYKSVVDSIDSFYRNMKAQVNGVSR